MTEQWTVGASANVLLDEGIYEAYVKELRKIDPIHSEAALWIFWVTEHDLEVSGISSLSPSGKSKPARWARSILELEKSQPVNWGPELAGKPCRVYIELNDDGDDNKVTKVLPPTEAQKTEAEIGEAPF